MDRTMLERPDIQFGDRVRATMYDGQATITGEVIALDLPHGLAIVKVATAEGSWPYLPKSGQTPRVALHNCERIP